MFGAAVIELIPRMIVGGVLVFLGLAFLVEWVWDKRRTLPPVEYGVVLVILAAIIARGFLPGVVLGLVLAVVLFAVSYGRIELVREVSFGETYHSNVDRPPTERAALRAMGDRVQILRLNGFVFFGSANGLLERIRKRVGGGTAEVPGDRPATGDRAWTPRRWCPSSRSRTWRRRTGSSSCSPGSRTRCAGSSSVGGVGRVRGSCRFEPDLDRGLQRCEEGLLEDAGAEPVPSAEAGLAGMPRGLRTYLERVTVPEGPC